MKNQLTAELLDTIVNRATRLGATGAEAVGFETTEFHVEVRLGQIEKLQEAASRGIGLRVLHEGRQASCSTSDLSDEAIDELLNNAVEMARRTSQDEAAMLPAFDDYARTFPDLGLYDEAIALLPTEDKVEMARACEDAALKSDPRIRNSEGGACSTVIGRQVLVTSEGFSGEFNTTVCSLMSAPIAGEGDQMQVAGWGDRQRSLKSLETPETIGLEAARRALRKLGGRKVNTRTVPIVFEASAAEDLLGDFTGAVDGTSIFRKASFLVGKLGEQIAVPELTIIDDGTMMGALGSRPFDGDGCPSQRTVIIENGLLKNYLLNTYTARKLGLRPTGNAQRGLTGAPSVGITNFFISPGKYSPEEIIASVKTGFLVTEMIGFGFNPVTGDYSRGASGWWIEDGKLIHPVEEVTIAGNFKEILRGIEMIGNDLKFRSRIAAPTIKIDRMTVSGN